MIKITLITPTRNRVNDLKNFFESIKATAKDPSSIEILFFVDDDDSATLPMIKTYEEEYKDFNVRFHVGKRSDHFSKDYYNFLARQAQGRWVMAVNDDSVFVTPGWDAIICAKMEAAAEAFGDDILLGIVQDGMIRKGAEKDRPTMSCWLLSSKQYVDLTGGLLIEEIYTWGGDYWLGRTFSKVQNGARKVFILDVLIEHNSHHANPRRPIEKHLPQPESFALFQRIESEHPCSFGEEAAQEKANMINDCIARLHV
jgi:glycosyltransferase involved in cell wall biosynthesis